MTYQFYADGVDFGQEEMSAEEAKAYAKKFQLTYEEV